jgi:hypothetical protein
MLLNLQAAKERKPVVSIEISMRGNANGQMHWTYFRKLLGTSC